MNLKRIYAIFIRQIFLYKSNPIRLSTVFLWLIIDIFQWGFISRFLGSLGQATFGFITVILGAIILWEFLIRIQQGIMTSFLEDVWSHNFINFFASPLRIREYLSGMVLTSITTGMAGFLVMVIISSLVFGYNFFKIGLMAVPFMLILFIFGIVLGVFTSALVFRFGPSAEWLAWPIPMILSLFAGVYYPIATLPVYLQIAAKFIPLSYVFESFRAILGSQSFDPNLFYNLIMGFLLSGVYLFLVMLFFNRVYRYNLKNGNIAKFNSE
jgi:ABC-2 type transport system permease protein